MAIARFFDKTVTIRRLKGSAGDRSYGATATVDGAIQELDLRARQLLGIVEQRGWVAYFDIDADIQEDDRLTDHNGKEYTIREITKKDYGINQHLEVVMAEMTE